MSEIRVTSVVGENGGDRVGLTTGLTVGPLTGTTGIGATISHQGHAQFAGVCTATSFVGNGANLTGLANGYGLFHVRANQNNGDTPQTVANVTVSKIQFKYELADLDGLFDNSTNYRYTPQVAGWYWVNLNISINNGGGHSHLMTAYLYKNGSQYATFEGGGGGSGADHYNRYGDNNSINMSSIIQLNGSSDYVEGYVYQTNAQSASRNLDNLSTTMMGYLVRRT